jgi:FG-GAP repeat
MFGYSLAINGDIIAVGAYKETFGGLEKGAVYIYQRDYLGLNNWGLVQKLIVPYQFTLTSYGHSFGGAVALDSDTLIVGDASSTYDADRDGEISCDSPSKKECGVGAAYVFQYDLGLSRWELVTQLFPSDIIVVDELGRSASQFGYSVSISGDTAVVGAPRRDSSGGAAYIFSRNQSGSNRWGEIQRITGAKTQQNPFSALGTSVIVSEMIVIVGAPGESIDGNGDGVIDCQLGDNSLSAGGTECFEGFVHIFEKDQVSSTWNEANGVSFSNVSSKNPSRDMKFGSTLALKGNILAVGARDYTLYKDDLEIANAGSVYLFNQQQGEWSFSRGLVSKTVGDYEYFGSSMAFDDSRIIIGAPGNNKDVGAFYIFE